MGLPAGHGGLDEASLQPIIGYSLQEALSKSKSGQGLVLYYYPKQGQEVGAAQQVARAEASSKIEATPQQATPNSNAAAYKRLLRHVERGLFNSGLNRTETYAARNLLWRIRSQNPGDFVAICNDAGRFVEELI